MKQDRALFSAIDKQDLGGVLLAIKNGANLDARRKFNTPLLDAVFSKNEAIVRALVMSGAAIENVKGSRDPLNESITLGDMPTVAALLGVNSTYSAIANSLHANAPQELNLPKWMLRNFLRPAWHPLLVEFARSGAISQQPRKWWQAACESYSAEHASVSVLEEQAPLTSESADLLSLLAKNGGSVPVFMAFARSGLLNNKSMFQHGEGAPKTEKGVLLLAMGQSYKPIPVLKWLVKHAASLPDGPALINRQIDPLMALSLGLHGSVPVARMIAKSAGVDVWKAGAGGVAPGGSSTLHLLMDRGADHRRNLGIAKMLLENGADPMVLNQEKEPACYRAALKGKFAPEAIRLFDQFGADWSEGGEAWMALQKTPDMHPNWITEGSAHIRAFLVEKQHALLQENTPEANRNTFSRRL